MKTTSSVAFYTISITYIVQLCFSITVKCLQLLKITAFFMSVFVCSFSEVTLKLQE